MKKVTDEDIHKIKNQFTVIFTVVSEDRRINEVRVPREVAKEFILRNESMILNGEVRYFRVVDLGLGICKLQLRDRVSSNDEKGTYLFKK